MASLKKNIILNYINTITGIIFPIITFPYAARVLHPEGIGLVNFQNSLVNYIVLFTSLGIPLYAVREIAKCRENVEQRNQTTVEILVLSTLLSIFGYLTVLALGKYVPRIHEEVELFYILSLAIICTCIGVQWFYQGIEDFVFITIRGIIVRFLCAIGLFLFVQDKDDILLYGLFVVGSTVGNNIINFVHLRKYIDICHIKWKRLNIVKHIKPSLYVFMLNLVISIYVQLNTIMLGFMTGDKEVGLYSSGSKITYVFIGIVTSLGTVMLPRCSHLLGEHRYEEFSIVIKKSYYLLMFMSIPITIGLIVLARPLMICFCGDNYAEATPVIIWTAPTVIFIGLTNIIGLQILYPYGKEKYVIYSTTVAAIVNIFLNLILIPLYAEIGTAITALIAEGVVLIVQIALGKKYIPFSFFDRTISLYIFASIVMAVSIYLCSFLTNDWVRLISGFLVGMIVYLYILYIKGDGFVVEMRCMFLHRILKKDK